MLSRRMFLAQYQELQQKKKVRLQEKLTVCWGAVMSALTLCVMCDLAEYQELQQKKQVRLQEICSGQRSVGAGQMCGGVVCVCWHCT
jgi:hypothetical protein